MDTEQIPLSPGALTTSRFVTSRVTANDIVLLVRFKAMGFTLAMPLLGAATVAHALDGKSVLALLGSTAAFHCFAYVTNDVIDLPVDRTEPLRRDYPLVRGILSPRQALAFALLMIPLGFAFTMLAGGGAQAYLAYLSALVAMTIYNLYGKRCFFPPLTDLVQGIGWSALLIYGALVGQGAPGKLTWLAALYVCLFIVMINGMHGSLRDLENDLRFGAKTTAHMLGARTHEGKLHIPIGLVIYTLLLESTLTGLLLVPSVRNWAVYYGDLAERAVIAALLAWVVSVGLLVFGIKLSRNGEVMIVAGMLHLLIAFGALIAVLSFSMSANLLLVILLIYFAPLLASTIMWRAVRTGLKRLRGQA